MLTARRLVPLNCHSGGAPAARVRIGAGRAACETGGHGEQVRCERVRDPATGRAPPAVRGPLAGGGPQQVKVVHHQEARRQLPGRTDPRCPDGPGVRSADRRASGLEPPGTRDRHLVPGGHRLRRDEMADPGRSLPGQPGRIAGHGHARTDPARCTRPAGSARAAHGLVPARFQSRAASRAGRRGRADPGLGAAGVAARRLPQRAGGAAQRGGGPHAPAGRQPGSRQHHHPQARRPARRARLRSRGRAAAEQPAGHHRLAGTTVVSSPRPYGGGEPRPGQRTAGRGRPDPAGADRLLRLPVLRRASPGGSRRPAHR